MSMANPACIMYYVCYIRIVLVVYPYTCTLFLKKSADSETNV